MQITPVKTHKITVKDTDILAVIDSYLPELTDGSVVAVSSKIVSICEGRLIKTDAKGREKLIIEESDRYIDAEDSPYGLILTISGNVLIPYAGIDESNVEDSLVLWPSDPYGTARKIKEHLKSTRGLKNLG